MISTITMISGMLINVGNRIIILQGNFKFSFSVMHVLIIIWVYLCLIIDCPG